ncbi:hypothetical protein AB0H94_05920 [Streptomyces purpurascens]|uniref:hypothetical protein n=1 Tax=Streptomyces purpurascens TaxID=1924 RepID=UPI0033C8B1CA
MQRGFLVGAVGGVTAMAAVGGLVTWLLASKDVQHTTIDTIPRKFYVKADGHLAVERTILEARIDGWYGGRPRDTAGHLAVRALTPTREHTAS